MKRNLNIHLKIYP